ncbi:hypothetical protein H2199_008898 [Coniosporium tulheliwenetii]|uniref:Uncharacterized protein n=1 Tax=Coniosporium tulheliwenetii TaxID=3383036 RepID=A0ACC2YHF8_9PEZI|nr:hypothetical protein H2199_008898 [Cladosporium sp. JES 115]
MCGRNEMIVQQNRRLPADGDSRLLLPHLKDSLDADNWLKSVEALEKQATRARRSLQIPQQRLEEERHKLIEKAMKVTLNYNPPSDLERPTKRNTFSQFSARFVLHPRHRSQSTDPTKQYPYHAWEIVPFAESNLL